VWRIVHLDHTLHLAHELPRDPKVEPESAVVRGGASPAEALEDQLSIALLDPYTVINDGD
jgi:hypothetical protein